MQKKQRKGQHAALGNASINGYIFGTKTVASDLDAASSKKAGDPLA